MKVDSGQFIGLRLKSWFSDSTMNMFSLYRSQCPDWRHSRSDTRIGVLTSW